MTVKICYAWHYLGGTEYAAYKLDEASRTVEGWITTALAIISSQLLTHCLNNRVLLNIWLMDCGN